MVILDFLDMIGDVLLFVSSLWIGLSVIFLEVLDWSFCLSFADGYFDRWRGGCVGDMMLCEYIIVVYLRLFSIDAAITT